MESNYLTCAGLSNLGDTAHCANDDIGRACCHCASVVQVSSSYVQVTLSISCTAEDQDELCQETNLAPGGGTYRSFVLAFIVPAGLQGSTTVTLSCTSGRRAGNRVRRLQTEFSLVSLTSFTNAEDAATLSERVNSTSSEMASAFQNRCAVALGTRVTATVGDVELTVTDEASACASRRPELLDQIFFGRGCFAALLVFCFW